MNRKDKAIIIQKKLNELYPNTPIPLKHTNTFTLLVAVVLYFYSPTFQEFIFNVGRD